MPRSGGPVALSRPAVRRLWMAAQGLDRPAPFGTGAAATPVAVEQLGYVQIDTINVIERCHHHILWSRIPDYRREHLKAAQSVDKSVFEYWTHALAYVPTRDFRFFMPAMRQQKLTPRQWFGAVAKEDLAKVLKRIRDGGPLTIRDIDDDVLIDKEHPWASRKPSKRALQMAFYTGALTISARAGMLKTYELTARHFGWEAAPRPATERQLNDYLLDRALRAQGVVSLDSVCHLDAPRKAAIREVIEARLRRRTLRAVAIEGLKAEHWAKPEVLDALPAPVQHAAHILSPFDPLIIQRKRLSQIFGYDHRFEAYVPRDKRVLGYFALPVVVDAAVVAAVDVKTHRGEGTLRVQQWTWFGEDAVRHEPAIEEALHRFERFQLQADEGSQEPPAQAHPAVAGERGGLPPTPDPTNA